MCGSYEAAYSGGSCLRISVSDDALGLVQLYESSISVTANRRLHVSYSVGAGAEAFAFSESLRLVSVQLFIFVISNTNCLAACVPVFRKLQSSM